MKKIVLMLFCCSAIYSSAQDYLIGVKGGISGTNISYARKISAYQDGQIKYGFSGGLTFDFIMKNHFSIGADLLYNQRGTRYKVDFTDVEGQYIGSSFIKEHFDYVSLPVMAGYHVGDKFFGFIRLGIASSMLLKKERRFSFKDEESVNETTENYNKYDFSGVGEIGGGYKLKDKVSFFASLAYQHSFTYFKTPPDSDLSLDKGIHYGLTLSAGVKYSI